MSFYPQDAVAWNILGFALFHQGRLREAAEALDESVLLRSGGDATDWFLLAMIHARQGDRQQARYWYQKDVKWTDADRPKDAEFSRLQHEASREIGD